MNVFTHAEQRIQLQLTHVYEDKFELHINQNMVIFFIKCISSPTPSDRYTTTGKGMYTCLAATTRNRTSIRKEKRTSSETSNK